MGRLLNTLSLPLFLEVDEEGGGEGSTVLALVEGVKMGLDIKLSFGVWFDFEVRVGEVIIVSVSFSVGGIVHKVITLGSRFLSGEGELRRGEEESGDGCCGV